VSAQTRGFVDRRRPRQPGQSAAEVLAAFSGVVLLERLSVPTLAVGDDGRLVFANGAFVAMVGHSQQQLMGMELSAIVPGIPLGTSSVVRKLREHANSIVELTHAGGWRVPTAMSASLH
jgi:PAS domain S-box-containing protein